MYFKETSFDNSPEFLASQKYVAFTTTITDVGVTADANGRKYVLGGTVIGVDGKAVAADGTSIATNAVAGILFATVDVTNGPQPGALMAEGYVREARLQQSDAGGALNATVKTSLNTKCPKITLR
jgi:hypothetical protein